LPTLTTSTSVNSTALFADESSFTSSDPLQLALNPVTCGSFQGPAVLKSEVFTFVMDHVMVCPVSTIAHVPHSVCPLLAKVLSVELCKACLSVWGFARLFMFAKAVLRIPVNNQCHHFVMSSILLDRLNLWNQSGGIHSLWTTLIDDLTVSKSR